MPAFSPAELLSALRAHELGSDARLCVALSGGLDSTVLVHALARLAAEQQPFELRAVHIDHQLHADSANWSAHCEQTCAALGVPITSIRVHVVRAAEGLEAAARRARYEAMRRVLRSDEILLTAHHADDQLETVLLNLLRGAGVNGLSGIPREQPFGAGRLLRPLLSFTRAELRIWAHSQRLHWVEDPSNDNVDLDRNYLRREVIPALQSRWPAAAHSASRSAAHLTEARWLLSGVADIDLADLRSGQTLSAAKLAQLDAPRRRNALRRWLHERGARMPSSRKLAAIESDLLCAGADRIPAVAWDDVVLRRYRGQLYLEKRQPPLNRCLELSWNPQQRLELPDELGALWLSVEDGGRLSAAALASSLTVRFRSGGERIKPAGDTHSRDLKKLLQAAGVPPWRRARIPLIYSGERLAAVGDLWVAEEFAARDAAGLKVIWERARV